MKKKTVYIMVPCRNECDNIEMLVQAVEEQFKQFLPEYDYIIQFSDNCSTDGTRDILRRVCETHDHVRAIFNSNNFRWRSGQNNFLNTEGDCVIQLVADFQDPVELIPKLVREWENGALIVCGVKTSSKENKLMYRIRTVFYKIMQQFSDVKYISHFSGYALYDKKFVDFIKQMEDKYWSIRGLIVEYGHHVVTIPYEQQLRKSGKSNQTLGTLYRAAMKNFLAYSKSGMTFATIGGLGIASLSAITGIVLLILKLIMGSSLQLGSIPIVIAVFFACAVQLFFIGLLGEYLIEMRTHVVNPPLVFEEERLNFNECSTAEIEESQEKAQ